MKSNYTYLYHFANYEEGFDVLKSYSKYPLDIEICLVISTSRFRPHSNYFFKNWLSHLAKTWYCLKFFPLLFNRNLKMQFIDDVNTQIFIHSIKPNSLGICTGFSQIFSPELLQAFSEIVNVHQSLLPFYKGPLPSYWCIKNKEAWTGYTLHKMTSKIDNGKILYQKKIPISSTDFKQLQKTISLILADDFPELIKLLVSGETNWYKRLDAKKIYTHHPYYLGFPVDA